MERRMGFGRGFNGVFIERRREDLVGFEIVECTRCILRSTFHFFFSDLQFCAVNYFLFLMLLLVITIMTKIR